MNKSAYANALKVYCAFMTATLFLSGCVLPRSHSALQRADQPLARTALLPVESPSLCANEDVSQEKVFRIGNAVLDTLAKSKEGSLMGPSEVATILGSNGIPACLSWKMNPPGSSVRSNDLAAVRLLASRLGVRQIVRCWIRRPDASAAWELAGERWVFELARNSTCTVSVNMQLIDVDTLKVVNTSGASGQTRHTVGFLLLPMYVGTTFGRAVDHAERTALTQLFKNQPATAMRK